MEINTYIPNRFDKAKDKFEMESYVTLTKSVYRNVDTDETLEDNLVEIEDKLNELSEAENGDMLKSVYDTDDDGIIDKASLLAAERTVRTDLSSLSADSFDGSRDITPGVTGTLGISNGGTGATTASEALLALGAAETFHIHTQSQISDFPTSMPASDVPAWAKADNKPTYTASEVSAVPTTRTINGKELSSDITITMSDIGMTFSTVDLTPGVSPLESGHLYFVYE